MNGEDGKNDRQQQTAAVLIHTRACQSVQTAANLHRAGSVSSGSSVGGPCAVFKCFWQMGGGGAGGGGERAGPLFSYCQMYV